MSSSESNSISGQDISSAELTEISMANNSVLQFFVESQWEKTRIKNLGEWLKSQDIDVNNPAWYSLFSRKRAVEDEKPNSSKSKTVSDSFKVRVTSQLKNILPFLLSCNDDVSFINKDGQTILHIYLANSESDYKNSQGNNKSKVLKIVKSLIKKGAPVNVVDKRGKTPLHIAAEADKFEILKLMLDSFTNVDACDIEGNTVLHTILERNSDDVNKILDIARILLGKGADPSKKNAAGMTPLHLAVCYYNVGILQIFKENGADFSISTDNDENALLLAYKHCIFRIPESTMLEIVNFLVDQGCDVNVQNKDGYSPVHYAVKWNTTLKRLIELGADVNYQTKIKRKSPLHLAVDMDRKECETVATLFHARADWDALDYKGRTPLDVAVEKRDLDMRERILDFSGHITNQNMRKLMHISPSGSPRIMLKRYVFMMGAIGFPFHGVPEGRNIGYWYDTCLQEVKKLETCNISKNISIYQFLHMSSRRQLAYTECLPKNLETEFPFYANFILRTRIDALRRKQLLEPAKIAWCQITQIDFPDICVERITYFLNNWNLTVLIRAAETMTDSESFNN